MNELLVNRSQPEIDPLMHAWRWEIPVDLFFAAAVAGMMVLSGLALLRARAGRPGLPLHAPLLAFALVHICLLALFLDLSHKLYVWNLYLTLQPRSPMSWGSWMLTLAYGVMAATALATLPGRWPWLLRRVPLVERLGRALAGPRPLAALAWANVVLGFGLALYTGVLLATMVARPLWNTMVLPPLFLASGLAAGAAFIALAARFVPARPQAPDGLVAGALDALVVPAAAAATRTPQDVAVYVRLALAFLAAQAVLLLLYVIGLATGSASQVAALQTVLAGPFAPAFWLGAVAAGTLLPLALLPLSLPRPGAASAAGGALRAPALAAAALVLLLAGGLVLRFILVDAGQAARLLPGAGVLP